MTKTSIKRPNSGCFSETKFTIQSPISSVYNNLVDICKTPDWLQIPGCESVKQGIMTSKSTSGLVIGQILIGDNSSLCYLKILETKLNELVNVEVFIAPPPDCIMTHHNELRDFCVKNHVYTYKNDWFLERIDSNTTKVFRMIWAVSPNQDNELDFLHELIKLENFGMKTKWIQVINHLMTNVITSNPFFMHLQHHTAELFHIMHLQVIDRGQHITRKGQLSRDMMVMLVGSAVILDESEDSVRAGQGDPIYPLYEVSPGAIFGERCALNLDDSYNTTVRALTNCEFYVIFSDELLSTLGKRLFNGLRRKCTTDKIFKVRLRTYGISNIPPDTMGMLRKMMMTLPSDPNRRTWSRRSKSKSQKSTDLENDHDHEEEEEEGEVQKKRSTLTDKESDKEATVSLSKNRDPNQKNVKENDKVTPIESSTSVTCEGRDVAQDEKERGGDSGGAILDEDMRIASAEMDEKEIEIANSFDLSNQITNGTLKNLSVNSIDGEEYRDLLLDMHSISEKVDTLASTVKDMQSMMKSSQVEQMKQQEFYTQQLKTMMDLLQNTTTNSSPSSNTSS